MKWVYEWNNEVNSCERNSEWACEGTFVIIPLVDTKREAHNGIEIPSWFSMEWLDIHNEACGMVALANVYTNGILA